MFKKLRERIAEEANKLPPVPQISFGNNSQKPPDVLNKAVESLEDDIMPSDGSSIIEPHAISQQFSIADDEDASMSEPSTPQKVRNESSSSEKYSDGLKHTPSNVGNNQSSQHPSYIPQTDIESGVEEPPTLNLDGISKEQLLTTIQLHKARIYKYRNKYGEVVKAYKSLIEEKNKIESALTDNQDKGLRRIAELREQCQLEQKAKAHLEENLRLILEEKESRISVLETQNNLLKEGQSENVASNISDKNKDTKDETQSSTEDEQQKLNAKLQSEHDEVVKELKKRLCELQQQQEDSIMSMAETKKNMHEELELKERQLNKTKDELRQIKNALEQEKTAYKALEKQKEDKQKDLQIQVELMEKTIEEEKENLLRDFARGKAEAIALIQEENAKKSSLVAEEWRTKLQNSQVDCENTLKKKDEELQQRDNELMAVKEQLECNLVNLKLLEDEKEEMSKTLDQLKTKQLLAADTLPVEEDLVVFKHVFKTGKETSSNSEDMKSFQQLQKSVDQSEEIERLQKDVHNLEQENENLKIKDKSFREKMAKQVKSLKTKSEDQLKQIERRSSELQQQNMTLNKSYENQIEDFKSRIEELQGQNNEFKTKYETEHKNYEGRLQELQSENGKLKEKCNDLVANLEARLSRHLQESAMLVSKYEEKINLLESHVPSFEKEKSSMRKMHEDEINKLELHITELQENNVNTVNKYQEEINTKILKVEEEKTESNERYENQVKALTLQIEQYSAQNTKLQEEAVICTEENGALKTKLEEEIKMQKLDLEKQISAMENQYQDEISALKKNIADLQERNSNSKREHKKQALQSQLSKLKEDNQGLKSKFEDLLKSSDLHASELVESNAKRGVEYEDRIKALELRICELEKLNDDLVLKCETETKSLLSQVEELSQKNSGLIVKIDELSREADAVKLENGDQVQAFELRIHELEDRNRDCENQAKELTIQLSELQENNANLKSQIDDPSLQLHISNIQKENKDLKEDYEEKRKSFKSQIAKLKKDNANLREQCDKEISLLQNEKTNLTTEYEEKFKTSESHVANLLRQISEDKKDANEKLVLADKEFKTTLEKQAAKEECRMKEIERLEGDLRASESRLSEHKSKVQEESKMSKILVTQLQDELSVSLSKIEELNEKIQLLEKEREQLMIKVQVAAKYSEEIELLNKKIQHLQLQHKEIAKLETQNSILNGQLDESLMVAAANQVEAEAEASSLNKKCEELQNELSSIRKMHLDRETEMERTISHLKQENINMDLLKTELCDENKILKEQCNKESEELNSLRCLKTEKDELNSTIQTLMSKEKQLNADLEALRIEVDVLRTCCNCKDCVCGEVRDLKSENESLSERIQSQNSCITCDLLKKDVDQIRKECDEMLRIKEEELNERIKQVVKEVSSQINIKDMNCDEALTEVIEKSHDVEEQLVREHRLEIVALRQEIFEKECALEEMHEHYEEILKAKQPKLPLYEGKSTPIKTVNSELVCGNESSDWDDTWVVPEENCDNLSPTHDDKSTHDSCDDHIQRIESMQKELAKCNSELKDLRILLRLSPPPSLHSNNNFNSSSHVPEPTEYEYLRNILFEYMMGKETVTLVKVIAAVLRFNDEQTRLILEREKAKLPAR